MRSASFVLAIVTLLAVPSRAEAVPELASLSEPRLDPGGTLRLRGTEPLAVLVPAMAGTPMPTARPENWPGARWTGLNGAQVTGLLLLGLGAAISGVGLAVLSGCDDICFGPAILWMSGLAVGVVGLVVLVVGSLVALWAVDATYPYRDRACREDSDCGLGSCVRARCRERSLGEHQDE